MNWSLKSWVRNVLAAGYDAAEYNRHHNQLSWGRSVGRDEDSLVGKWDRARLRLECINLRRNDALVSGVGERFADNVVGGGICPQAKTSSDEWNNEAEAFWANWSKVCDLRQRINMRDVQRLTVQARLFHGDVGYVLTDGGQLQPVESERISTPDKFQTDPAIIEGVKIDRGTGIMLGAFVFPRDKDGKVDTSGSAYEFVPRENFVFCSHPMRFDQVRGIPELAPVINDLRYMHSLQAATLERANIDAMRSWQITRAGPSGIGNLGGRDGGTSVGSPAIEKMESGMTYYMKPGEKAESLASNTPNDQYFDFTRLSLRMIGSSLCLPYEFMLLDFSQGSFSSSRAVLLQTYRTFSGWQEWLTSAMLQRVWNWRIAKAIKHREISQAPLDGRGVSEWYKVQWSYPEFGWIDPQSESTSNQLDFNMGATTLSAITRKKGRDAEDVLREKGMDIREAMKVAEEVNAEMGTDLTWRDLISTLMPGANPAGSNKQADENGLSKEEKESKELDKWLT